LLSWLRPGGGNLVRRLQRTPYRFAARAPPIGLICAWSPTKSTRRSAAPIRLACDRSGNLCRAHVA